MPNPSVTTQQEDNARLPKTEISSESSSITPDMFQLLTDDKTGSEILLASDSDQFSLILKTSAQGTVKIPVTESFFQKVSGLKNGLGGDTTSKEIERKFLMPSNYAAGISSQEIQQGYLGIGSDKSEVRVRAKGEKFFLTVKTGSGQVRGEAEQNLDEDTFYKLLPLCAEVTLEKTRGEIILTDSLTIECDRYSGKFSGLSVAEIEFSDEASANSFDTKKLMPHIVREVTNDGRFKNAKLAGLSAPEAKQFVAEAYGK